MDYECNNVLIAKASVRLTEAFLAVIRVCDGGCDGGCVGVCDGVCDGVCAVGK